MVEFIAVALGGAIGASFRALLHNKLLMVSAFTFITSIFIVNMMGCFFAGAIKCLCVSSSVSKELQSFLLIGVTSSFTTFSSIIIEMDDLSNDSVYKAVLYVVPAIILGFVAYKVGYQLTRWLVI